MTAPTRSATLRLADRAASRIADRAGAVVLRDLAGAAPPALTALAGRSVMVRMSTQLAAGAAFVHLDGLVRRMTIAPPDLKADQLASVVEDAEVDTIVSDVAALSVGPDLRPTVRFDPADPARQPVARDHDTEWVMLTSGTSGRPKLVAHTLAALTGAIRPGSSAAAETVVWSTFYDIRRYGGLQIFFRAILRAADLVLTGEDEPVDATLRRLGAAGATSISGTPSHWRRVLMNPARDAIRPRYVRLSGETADRIVLDGLRAAYPEAAIGHAYASTEAGVGFAVDDGREGFPAALVERPMPSLAMRVVDGTLRIRSDRAATRYLGAAPPDLRDADGYVDTGDLVERRGDRYLFAGRRGGIVNVGGLKVNPEEVEVTISGHPDVRMALVKGKRSPLVGAVVVADVVVREGAPADDALRDAILALCRARLEPHKVPALLRFVPSLPLTPAGKLARAPGGLDA